MKTGVTQSASMIAWFRIAKGACVPRGFGLLRLDAAFGFVAGMALEWKITAATPTNVQPAWGKWETNVPFAAKPKLRQAAAVQRLRHFCAFFSHS